MRGPDVMNEQLFTVGGLDQYVPVDHPLRRVREVFNGSLASFVELGDAAPR